jgi:hypothetical protein
VHFLRADQLVGGIRETGGKSLKNEKGPGNRGLGWKLVCLPLLRVRPPYFFFFAGAIFFGAALLVALFID